MRLLAILALVVLSGLPVAACSCVGAPRPAFAVGQSEAVFVGKVLEILPPAPEPSLPAPVGGSAQAGSRRTGEFRASGRVFSRPLRTIRMRVTQKVTGLPPDQDEINIGTGTGGGDCGYAFEVGAEYVVYTDRRPGGMLETSICNRTRPLDQAAEDLAYFQSIANPAVTGELRVHSGTAANLAVAGEIIIAAGGGAEYTAVTNAAGEATFHGLPPGEYTIHSKADGELPDDPKVRLREKGIVLASLVKFLRIEGRVTTKDGRAAEGVIVQCRALDGDSVESAGSDAAGHFLLRIARPGRYHAGINLAQSATHETPYPRWFFPGTGTESLASEIVFTGKPETQRLDLILPEPLRPRIIEGTATLAEGQPAPRASLTLTDSFGTLVSMATADRQGHFRLSGFEQTAYRLLAVFHAPSGPVSAAPLEVSPSPQPLNVELKLNRAGNVILEESEKRAKAPRQ